MSKKKEKKSEFFSIFGDEKKRSGIMFILAIVFFGTLIVMVRNGGTAGKNTGNVSKPNGNGSEEEKVTDFTFLTTDNYFYTYIFEENDSKEMITGKKYGEKEKFTIINNKENKEAGKLKEQYLIKENNQYVFSTLPSEKLLYTEASFLEQIVELATAFEEKKGYTVYTVDPVDLIDMFNSDVTYDPFGEFEDDSVEIYKKDDQVTKVIFILNNYIQNITADKTKTFKITLEYSNVGNVEDFDLN